MKFIKISSLPLDEVIKDIALQLGVPCVSECGEHSLTIPERLGIGGIRGICFTNGLGVVEYNCTFKENFSFKFIMNKVHPLKFLYCQDGALEHKFEHEEAIHCIDTYQNIIVASQSYNGHILDFKANVKTVLMSMEIDRAAFVAKISCDLENAELSLRTLFGDVGAKESFYYNGFYSLKIADLVHELNTYETTGITRKFCIEGNAYNILAQQIIQYQDDNNQVKNRKVLRKSEVALIITASEMIEDEIADLGTIQELAARIGINVNKLQEGFKYQYLLTVNGFIQKTRLDLAKKLLVSTDFDIGEIVEKVGLSSNSYFSKIFKDKYEVTPTIYRNQSNGYRKGTI